MDCRRADGSRNVWLDLSSLLAKFNPLPIVHKVHSSFIEPRPTHIASLQGSVALDGVSLTVAELKVSPGKCLLRVSLIPFTCNHTIFGKHLLPFN